MSELKTAAGRDLVRLGANPTFADADLAKWVALIERQAAAELRDALEDLSALEQHLNEIRTPCPGGCGCLIGQTNPDASECGCDSYCTTDPDEWPALLAAVPEPALNVERLVELVTLVRAGFLVEVGGNRTTVADVVGEPYRSLLMTILEAPDSATAAAHLSDPSNG